MKQLSKKNYFPDRFNRNPVAIYRKGFITSIKRAKHELKDIWNAIFYLVRTDSGICSQKIIPNGSYYVNMLDAFKDELVRLDKENPGIVAERLVEYLIGDKGFYKVIKSD